MKPLRAYLFAAFTGLVAISFGFYWVGNWGNYVLDIPKPWHHVVTVGYAFLVSHLFGLVFASFNLMRERATAAPLLLFPLSLSAVTSIFPMVFPFTFGSGLSYFLTFIQPIDITGVYGLDFMVGLINYLVFLGLKDKEVVSKDSIWQAGAVFVALWLVYGLGSLAHWDEKIATWEQRKIGIVQTNRPASLGRPKPEPGFSRTKPYELMLTDRLSKMGAEVVIWPEGKFFGLSFWPLVAKSFHAEIDRIGSPIIFHDTVRETLMGKKKHYNSSLLIRPNQGSFEAYHKMQLVPFGEYTPFGENALVKWLLGNYASSLDAGKTHKTFEVKGMRFVPKLCYESQFSSILGQAIGADGKGKVLLVQSQDGWYGKSNQPEQHMASSVLRAVENRIPLVHVINNGSSAIAGPQGRYYYKTRAFEEVNSIGLMPFDPGSGGSFFSENPYLFVGAIRFIFLLYFLVAFKDWLLGRKKHED